VSATEVTLYGSVRIFTRDGSVDSDLSGLDVALESGGSGTAVGEDGNSVTVLVGIDQLDGVLKGIDVEADEDGTEDFLGVALHASGDVGEDGGANLNTISNGRFGGLSALQGGSLTKLPLGYFSGL